MLLSLSYFELDFISVDLAPRLFACVPEMRESWLAGRMTDIVEPGLLVAFGCSEMSDGDAGPYWQRACKECLLRETDSNG